MSWKTTSSSVGLACSVALIVSMINPSEAGLKITQEGLKFIGLKEGCSRKPYFCSADMLTWGLGSTSPVPKNFVATDAQIRDAYIRDVRRAERDIRRRINLPSGPVHDMMVSFVFNLGSGNFARSTMLKKLKRGDIAGACNEFPRWRYVSGRDCQYRLNNCYGIVVRRAQERGICLNGY